MGALRALSLSVIAWVRRRLPPIAFFWINAQLESLSVQAPRQMLTSLLGWPLFRSRHDAYVGLLAHIQRWMDARGDDGFFETLETVHRQPEPNLGAEDGECFSETISQKELHYWSASSIAIFKPVLSSTMALLERWNVRAHLLLCLVYWVKSNLGKRKSINCVAVALIIFNPTQVLKTLIEQLH